VNLLTYAALATLACIAGALAAPAFGQTNADSAALSAIGQGLRDTGSYAADAAKMISGVNTAAADAPRARGAREIAIYESIAPSVVLVVSLDERGKPNGIGSGSLIDTDGRILTNFHVIEAAAKLAVVFKPKNGEPEGKTELHAVSIERVDQTRDLAVLVLKNKPSQLRPIALGSLSGAPIGADVHAIGHPQGESWTYTKGVVSQIRRNTEWAYKDAANKHKAGAVIQTQTPINPGNSGGPLLNDEMQIVGVNTYGNTSAQGLNYAVSVDDVKAFLAAPAQLPASAKRPAPTPEKAQAAVPEKGNCPPKLGKRERSKENDAWLIEAEMNCAGRINSYIKDFDAPKSSRVILLDRDGDGRVDAVYFFKNKDEPADYAEFDTLGRGKLDVRVFFNKANGEIARVAKIEG
jgi:S1-C subfamily serine protease